MYTTLYSLSNVECNIKIHILITIHHYIYFEGIRLMEYKQVKSIKIERVAFLAWDMPTHARDMPAHQDVHTSGYSCGVQ